jgi:hypothetical protein
VLAVIKELYTYADATFYVWDRRECYACGVKIGKPHSN